MLSFAISDLDLLVLIGGGFGAVCAIMGVIAYASMQTMKSVKAESKWKELFAFWGSKRDVTPVGSSPASLQSMMSTFSLQVPPSYSQFQLSGPRAPSLRSPVRLGAQDSRRSVPSTPKQELIPWWDSSSPADTLYNDSSEAAVSDSPLDSSAAPPPFGDELSSKQTRIPKLPSQEYRIVIGNGLKGAARTKRTRQRRKSVQQPNLAQQVEGGKKEERVAQVREIKQELPETNPTMTPPFPASPAPISETITPPLTMSAPIEEIETPIISRRNVKSLMKKNNHGLSG